MLENNLVIELHVPDFKKTIEFYTHFGFSVARNEKEEKNDYLILERNDDLGSTYLNFYGNTEKIYSHSYFKSISKDTPRGYGVEITIPVSNIELLWKAIKSVEKIPIAQELTLKKWGSKDFRVVDPHGFYIRFTEMVQWGIDE